MKKCYNGFKLNIAVIAVLLFMCASASAAPFSNKTISVTQPDGKELSVTLTGDEFSHVTEYNGYTVVKNSETSEWQYAVLQDGVLVASGVAAQMEPPVGLELHLRASNAITTKSRMSRLSRMTRARTPANVLVGKRVGVCILVTFPDDTNTVDNATMDDFLNKEGYTGDGNSDSVRGYFLAMSDQKLDFTNIVVGPFEASKNKSEYDADEYYGAEDLLTEALEWTKANGFDFSQCDGDNDGIIDAISLFYAGEMGQGALWAHQSTVEDFSANGVQAKNYQMSFQGDKLTTYTFIHESMHMLGDVMDLYDTTRTPDGDYSSAGMGLYSVMSAGPADEGKPQRVCAYFRYRLGWITPTEITSSTSQAFNLNATTANALLYKKSDTEYFLVENRNASGWDVSLPDSGIVIYHCDENGSNDNAASTEAKHYECALEQADGRMDLERNMNTGDDTDLFDLSMAFFNDTTTPDALWWDGSASMLALEVKSGVGDEITVSINGGTTVDPGEDPVSETKPSATIEVAALTDGAGTGDDLILFNLDLDPGQTASGDLYVVVVLPEGSIVSLHPDTFTLDISPYSQTVISEMSGTILSIPVSMLPVGAYSFISVITPAGVSPMDSSQWIDAKFENFAIN